MPRKQKQQKIAHILMVIRYCVLSLCCLYQHTSTLLNVSGWLTGILPNFNNCSNDRNCPAPRMIRSVRAAEVFFVTLEYIRTLRLSQQKKSMTEEQKTIISWSNLCSSAYFLFYSVMSMSSLITKSHILHLLVIGMNNVVHNMNMYQYGQIIMYCFDHPFHSISYEAMVFGINRQICSTNLARQHSCLECACAV